ncbi:hypothetical protein [Gloeocapsopsis dulcis]|uniref:hypothetical protein n=1 Tax=Gloeocapsopsis dulcis TaxID=2859516 RepID=UPI0012DA8F01|nr:hypothetical protein [Gloeocapsopsis dulcis]WNN90599.1 hypothetical protein P0S91_05810 [Gloeocapsopsis dulcis]
MNFIDCALLTVFNTAVCIALPKLISAALASKAKRDRKTPSAEICTAQTVTVKIHSFS